MIWLLFRLVFSVIGLAFYFIPSIVAYQRKHPNLKAILVLNVLLGWSVIGWVVALVWSLTKTDKE